MTQLSASPLPIRLDVYTANGDPHTRQTIDVRGFYGADPRASVPGTDSTPVGWASYVLDPAGPEPAIDALLSTLSLYLGKYEWSQLETSQKELFADRIDRHQTIDSDGIEPFHRWWRNGAAVQEQVFAEPDLDELLIQFSGEYLARIEYRENVTADVTFAEWNTSNSSETRVDEFDRQARTMARAGLLSWPSSTANRDVTWVAECDNGYIRNFGHDAAAAIEFARRARRKRRHATIIWSFPQM